METIIKEVVHLTAQDFKEKVFDYEKGSDWKYEGNLPAIVDFYADWCQPCKMVAPVLEQIAECAVDRAMFADLRVRHAGVGGDFAPGKTRLLAIAGGLHAVAHRLGGLPGLLLTQFVD